MIKQKKKSEIQKAAFLLAQKANFNCTLAMATGSGKSKAAIDIAMSLNNPSILLVVPTEKLRDKNWPDEFKKWGADKLNVRSECYASIAKIKNQTYDLVIFDEAHRLTPANSVFFDNNTFTHAIGLTATVPKDTDKKAIINKHIPICFRYSLEQAVKDGVVSPYTLNIVYYNLDETEKYIEAKKKMFTERGRYNFLTSTIDYLLRTRGASNKWINLARARLLYSNKSKLKAAKVILNTVIDNDDRTVIFAGSIADTKLLCKNTFHSKSDDKDFDKFVNKKINRLATVDKLNEGHNLNEIDSALILKINSNPLNFIQRIGRAVRYREDHVGKIWVVVATDTVEERWLNNCLNSLGENKINKYYYDNKKKTLFV